jgi:hypothetical protein
VASDPVSSSVSIVQPGPEEITPLVFPSVSIAAGSSANLTLIVPPRPIANLNEDTYSYAFINIPNWVTLSLENGQGTYRYPITSNQTINEVANLIGRYPLVDGGWIRERWKSEFVFVRTADGSVTLQLVDGVEDLCAFNPLFQEIDLFGFNNTSEPFEAVYVRIAHYLYGLNNYTQEQHAAIQAEVAAFGYIKQNLDGTYALDPVAYPKITAWYGIQPSRFRQLGGGRIIRSVPAALQTAWDDYWNTYSTIDSDYYRLQQLEVNIADDSNYIIYNAPNIDFARGKLYRIDLDLAQYVWYRQFTPAIAPPVTQSTGTYTVTVRTTSNLTGRYYDSPWNITVLPQGSQGVGGILTTTQAVSNITLRQGVSARPFVPMIVSGGALPYTFTVTSPSLPADIQINSVNGEIYGAPLSTQTSIAYTITVNDSAGASRSRSLNVTVVSKDDVILAEDYNYIQRNIDEILGTNPDGWGYPSHYASPVTTRNRATRAQWSNILSDINVIRVHVTNTGTSTQLPSTSSVITSNLHTVLENDINWLYDPSRRYTCHPEQFANDGVPNVLYGTSTRTTVWSRSIEHKVRLDWPTDRLARYFFNQGSQFVWRPYYLSGIGNDRDGEWINFINYLQDTGYYTYTRADFVNPSTTKITTYTSGTLSISIVATRRDDITASRRIDFSAKFENTDVGDLIVDPTYGYWNYGPWEAFVTDSTSTHISSTSTVLALNNAQSGFSIDQLNGVIMLYMGAWPNEYASCNPDWLAFSNLGINKLGNNENSNNYRYNNGLSPYWTMGGEYNLSSIPIGTTVQYQIPREPYNQVAYTYSITRVNANSVNISTYTAPWNTGDDGNNITIAAWWRVTNELWGYTPAILPTYDGDGGLATPGTPAVLGVGTFTW